jgi:hypothetical protein
MGEWGQYSVFCTHVTPYLWVQIFVFRSDVEVRNKNAVFMDWKLYADGYQNFSDGKSYRDAAELCGVPYSCFQRRLHCGLDTTLRSEEGQVIFSEAPDHELVSSILNLSALGFGIHWDDVRNVALSFAQSVIINHCFSVNNRMVGSDCLE